MKVILHSHGTMKAANVAKFPLNTAHECRGMLVGMGVGLGKIAFDLGEKSASINIKHVSEVICSTPAQLVYLQESIKEAGITGVKLSLEC